MIDMVKNSRFVRPKKELEGGSSPNLFVANCGPAVGISYEDIATVFSTFGEIKGVHAADESGARVVVSYFEDVSAQNALKAFDGIPCPQLGGRVLHIRYSILQPSPQVKDSVSVSLEASELQIPGLFLLHDFITTKEEEELLAAVDGRPWKGLAKRRVQHYGYEFLYETRNVNTKQHLGELPPFVSTVLQKISSFPNLKDAGNDIVNQLTVNEYPPGVGLSPHIDTHSAFEGLIFSLSLAGPCIMEFRRYSQGSWLPPSDSSMDKKEENADNCSTFLRRSLFLPPRSMLLLSDEARYAWHHYIPHHKVDMVRGDTIRRGARRVSLTLRKVRGHFNLWSEMDLAAVNFLNTVILREGWRSAVNRCLHRVTGKQKPSPSSIIALILLHKLPLRSLMEDQKYSPEINHWITPPASASCYELINVVAF